MAYLRLRRRDDDDDDDEYRYCYDRNHNGICDDVGFWYSDKGNIVKWAILATVFALFVAWIIGGRMHAKRRLRKGLPLLGYHRWLVSHNERRRYGQAPQNHFTFYRPHAQQPYAQRTDGPYTEPPPLYNGNDAPPSYFAPPPAGGPKPHGEAYAMRAAPPPGPYPMHTPMGGQESGVVASGSNDVESQAQGQSSQGQQPAAPALPARPEQAKAAFSNIMSRFKRQ